MDGQTDIEVLYLFIINNHADTHIGRCIFYGQQQILLVSVDTYEAMSFS